MNENKMEKLDSVVIRFSGDSGDGMQLTGTLFSSLSAILGNEIATFPDYPAEIRAPQGTVSGVSGFQVNVGSGINTPGDHAHISSRSGRRAAFSKAPSHTPGAWRFFSLRPKKSSRRSSTKLQQMVITPMSSSCTVQMAGSGESLK